MSSRNLHTGDTSKFGHQSNPDAGEKQENKRGTRRPQTDRYKLLCYALMTGDYEVGPRSKSERSTAGDIADSNGGGLMVVSYETLTQHMAAEFTRQL